MSRPDAVVVDGSSVTLAQVVRVARRPEVPVVCAPEAIARVAAGRLPIERVVESYRQDYEAYRAGERDEPPVQDYGVTTGFGEFKDLPVRPQELEQLQCNILLSHAVGVGANADPDDPGNYYPAEVVRATLLLRLNAFLKGHSGVRVELVEAIAAMLNRGIVPRVPLHGSVGSSGDLCPLAHLFVVLLGEGSYRRITAAEQLARSRELPLRDPARHLAEDLGMEPPRPGFKEGLALVNGTTLSTALLALAVHDARSALAAADLAAAMSLEAVCGCARALDPKVHDARGQRGQRDSAAHLRRLLAGSRLLDSSGAVQDLYSLRCAPAVHGASRDAVEYVAGVVERELNAATDNPLFFPGPDGALHLTDQAGAPWDFEFRGNWPAGYAGDRRASYSAGNFHGQPIALAADFMTIALAELANISERRGQLLLSRHQNRNLPANLIPARGVNSGLMIAQYCAAGLVSENKVLAHPASVDSIPTSSNNEDHNSMSTIAARKARTVLANLQAVLALELMVAAQAIDWRAAMDWPAHRAAPEPSEEPEAMDAERERFAEGTREERRQEIADHLGVGTRAAYLALRRAVAPLVRDRTLDGDVLAIRRMLVDGSLVAQVLEAVEEASEVVR